MNKQNHQQLKTKLESSSPKENRDVLLYLHKQTFHLVKSYIIKTSGNTEDAEDIFQDGLFILLKMAKQNKLPEELNVEAYLFTICKNRWKKLLMTTGNKTQLTDEVHNFSVDDSPIDHLIDEEKKKAVIDILEKLCSDCQQLLIYYYYEKKKMKTIANLMGYAGEAVAKNKKSKCMKKLRDVVSKSDPNLFKD